MRKSRWAIHRNHSVASYSSRRYRHLMTMDSKMFDKVYHGYSLVYINKIVGYKVIPVIAIPDPDCFQHNSMTYEIFTEHKNITGHLPKSVVNSKYMKQYNGSGYGNLKFFFRRKCKRSLYFKYRYLFGHSVDNEFYHTKHDANFQKRCFRR